jgi:chromate reductase, NAD(P)H dehydrogenase (quinone)
MITIISGTNRIDSVSSQISLHYQQILEKKGFKSQILDLATLPQDFIYSALYENSGLNSEFNIFQEIIDGTERFVFIIPEYNNSFPGVLKAFIDGLRYPGSFEGKKGAMVGISSGAQGAGLAMSHFTDILHYLGMHVIPLKPKLSRIEKNFKDNQLSNDLYKELLEQQADQLINF